MRSPKSESGYLVDHLWPSWSLLLRSWSLLLRSWFQEAVQHNIITQILNIQNTQKKPPSGLIERWLTCCLSDSSMSTLGKSLLLEQTFGCIGNFARTVKLVMARSLTTPGRVVANPPSVVWKILKVLNLDEQRIDKTSWSWHVHENHY